MILVVRGASKAIHHPQPHPHHIIYLSRQVMKLPQFCVRAAGEAIHLSQPRPLHLSVS